MCNSLPIRCNWIARKTLTFAQEQNNMMTLAQQFPDVSMLIREKKKLNLKYSAEDLFKEIHYNPTSADQKFYDQEFRNWHYKLLISMGLLFTGLFFLVYNARIILTWLGFYS
jgi:hypothetical protein